MNLGGAFGFSNSGATGGGGGDKNYVHTQSVASAIWLVPHNLNKKCAVQIADDAGNEIEGGINWVNNNEVIITFTKARVGSVFCN